MIFVELRGQYILPFDFIEHYKVSRLNCTNLFVTTDCLNNLSTDYTPAEPANSFFKAINRLLKTDC